MKGLVNYQFKTFVKSSRFIMPMAVYLILMVMISSGAIKSVVSVMAISTVVLYFLMVWSGFVFSDSEDIIAEQIAVLKAGNNKRYYTSKVVFIMCWGIGYAVIGTFIPIIWAIIGGFDDFTLMNVLAGFLMQLFCCMLGGNIGLLWHPRVMNDRKIAAIGAFSVSAMGLICGPLSQEFGFLMFLRWICPPIYNILDECGMREASLDLVNLALPLGWCFGYTIILGIIIVSVLNKKGF